MSYYATLLNPFTGKLQLSPTNVVVSFKAGVATQVDLPLTNNSKGDGRIANDTGVLYTWSIDSSTGILSDWVSAGDIIDLTWDAISGKPSSTPSDIDNVVGNATIDTTLFNTILGNNAGGSITTAVDATLVGDGAGSDITSGTNNTCIGYHAGQGLAHGTSNVFIGKEAGLTANTGSTQNTIIGTAANKSPGNNNTSIGYGSGSTHGGNDNTFIGKNSGGGGSGASGNYNIYIGLDCGRYNDGGSNVLVGYKVGLTNRTWSNKLAIDNSDTATPLLYGEFDNRLVRINGALDVTGNITVTGTVDGIDIGTDVADNTSARHTQGTDLGLDTGGTNPVTAAIIKVVTDNTTINSSTVVFGTTDVFTGSNNVLMGAGVANQSLSGTNMVAIGRNALNGLGTHSNAIAIGSSAGAASAADTNFLAIGRSTKAGTGSIIIGYQLSLVSGANRLAIHNSNTSTPLLYGEFDNGLIKINGNLFVGTVKSGATQAAAGAAADEIWKTDSHATLPDNVLMIGT